MTYKWFASLNSPMEFPVKIVCNTSLSTLDLFHGAQHERSRGTCMKKIETIYFLFHFTGC